MHLLKSITQAYATKIKIKDKKTKRSNKKAIKFNKGLIDLLESDHDEIVSIYSKILDSAKYGEFIKLEFLLVDFATVLKDHIQVEDEQLYGYLTLLASNKSQLEQKIISDFSSEMKDISNSIFEFLNTNSLIPVNDENIDEFVTEFKKIGILLQDRVLREEKNLYPIYKKSKKEMTSLKGGGMSFKK